MEPCLICDSEKHVTDECGLYSPFGNYEQYEDNPYDGTYSED
jgi:hypothetical protein